MGWERWGVNGVRSVVKVVVGENAACVLREKGAVGPSVEDKAIDGS